MGRFTSVKKVEEKPPEIHPVWRGVGFLLMILEPFMAFAGAMLLIGENDKQGWVPIPPGFLVKAPWWPTNTLGPWPSNILVIALVTVLLWVALFAVISFITFLSFRLFGPPRYSDTNLPPVSRKVRRRWKQ